jgi:hypothetical protein
MAIPKIKTTYSLDEATVRDLDKLAERWQVSKSEALRRIIRDAAEASLGEDDPTEALSEMQNKLRLSKADTKRWVASVRQERKAN